VLRQKARELLIADQTVDLLLPRFLEIIKTPEIRAVFDQSTGGNAALFAEWLPRVASGEARLVVDRERTYVFAAQGELVQGTIDRLVQIRVGNRIVAAEILDFKTDRVSPPVEDWVRQKCEHYRSQMNEYRAAVARISGLNESVIPVRLLLVEAGLVPSV
jgi:ATP-dependent exoDNAse (exonuclease V) beta subunit